MKSIGLSLFKILQDYRTKKIIEKCYVLPEVQDHYPDEEVNYFQPNRDVPDNIQWFEMGIVERKNEHLDPVKDDSQPHGYSNMMNDRHFREMCVQIGNQNFAIKLKTKPDIEPPDYLKVEWVAKKLRIPLDLAMQVVELFCDMQIDRKTAMKMFFSVTSYCWAGGQYTSKKKTIRKGRASSKEIARDIAILRMIHEDASEPEWAKLKDNNFAEPIDETWIYMTEEVIESIEGDPKRMRRLNEETNGEYQEDHMDVTSPAYPFALFPLQWGAEALSHEFIQMIKEADWDKIKIIQRRFFAQYDQMAGRWYAPEYWYLSPTQKSQAWVYINARKEQLTVREGDLSEECKQCLYWIRQYKRSKYSTALIYAFKKGSNFNDFGISVKFKKPADQSEVNFLWSEYKKVAENRK